MHNLIIKSLQNVIRTRNKVSWNHLWNLPRFHLSSLLWLHNERNGFSDPQLHDCLLNRLFRHRSKKTSKLCVTGLCVGNSPVTGEFPAQKASNVENVSIGWRHHVSQHFTQAYNLILEPQLIEGDRKHSHVRAWHLTFCKFDKKNSLYLIYSYNSFTTIFNTRPRLHAKI